MSGVIYLGLVVMWVVVLVPMWLRRHDEVEETRSVDRFTSAMHTLSRHDAPADKKYVVMPHRSRALDVHVSGASADGRRKPRRSAPRRPAAARRVMTPAARRRRTLIGLLVTTLLTVVAAVELGGLALWALQIVADACLVAFVAHLRNRVRRTSAARPVRRRRPAATKRPVAFPRPVRAPRPARMPRPAPLAEPERVVAPVAASVSHAEPLFDQTAALELDAVMIDDRRQVVYHFDDTAVDDLAYDDAVVDHPAADAPAETVEVERVAAYEPAAASLDVDVDVESEIGERPWEPVPVPRPTYTTKPVAPRRRPRAPIFEPLLPPVDSPAELDPVDDLEEILDRRWAVND